MKDHILKIGADGAQLPADSTEYVAIHNTKTGLMVCAPFADKRFEHPEALTAIAGLSVAGFNDWRPPTVEELFPMADRTRFDPAVDPRNTPSSRATGTGSAPWMRRPPRTTRSASISTTAKRTSTSRTAEGVCSRCVRSSRRPVSNRPFGLSGAGPAVPAPISGEIA